MSPQAARHRRATHHRAVTVRRAGFAALGSATLLVAGCASGPLPEPVTNDGESLFRLWGVFFWIAVAVAAFIWMLTGYTIISSIRRRRRDAAALPRQRQYNSVLEIVYTAIPLVIVAGLFLLSNSVTDEINAVTDEPALEIEVVGFQWQWQFRYPEQDRIPRELVVSGQPGPDGYPELVLPVGSRVRFTLRADDVIHSFWVPEFLEKRDLIPGVTESPSNVIEVTVTEPGEWVGRCAEYCGLDHWKMAFRVRAIPPEEFGEWVAESSEKPQPMIAGADATPGTTATTQPVSGR